MSLFSLVPGVYWQTDSDKSLAYLLQELDGKWSEIQGAVDSFPESARFAESTAFVNEWLVNHGNPFHIVSDPEDGPVVPGHLITLKLMDLYSKRGTEAGMLEAIQFFLGLNANIQYDYDLAWILGTSQLGNDTKLVQFTSSYLEIHFYVTSLSDVEMRVLSTIVEFYKPIHIGWRVVFQYFPK